MKRKINDIHFDISSIIDISIAFICISLLLVSFSANKSVNKYDHLSEKNQQSLLIWNSIESGINTILTSDIDSIDDKYSSIVHEMNEIISINELDIDSYEITHNSAKEIIALINDYRRLLSLFYLQYKNDGILDVNTFGSIIEKSSFLERKILANHELIEIDISRNRDRDNFIRTTSLLILVFAIFSYIIYQNAKRRRIYQVISDNSRFMKENPDPVLRISHNMRIINANSAAHQLLRKWKSGIGEGVPQYIEEILEAAINEKSKKIFEEKVGFKTYQIAIVYIHDTEYLNLYANDVSELKMIQAEAQQRQKLEALGLLAGGIAHDFNNLLTGIMNATQLIQNTVNSSDEEIFEYTEMIIEASEHAADLTKKLLDFSRTDKVKLKPLNLDTIILSTITILERTLNKKIRIQYFNEDDTINVLADRGGLQRIFLNMGINSSHAMPDGGTLTFRIQRVYLDEIYCKLNNNSIVPGEYCKIEIEDTGTGINSENLKKIFDPFYSTKGFGKGTGLGLSSAYGIVQQHHGFIHVYSEEYVGTVFHIYIPCIEDLNKEVKRDELVTGSGRILLVDDEYLVRVTTEALLVSLGYQVITACNGMEAIKLFKKSKKGFDLVIVDMIMPGLTGREVAQELKEIDDECRVLLSSGFSKDDDSLIAEDKNLSGFLKKPYRDIQISKTVHEIINTSYENKAHDNIEES